MLNIMNKGYIAILKLFYKNRSDLHLRAIAKATGLNGHSAYRFLERLEKDQILSSRKQGNMRLFSLRHNNRTHAILTFFDTERYQTLPHIRRTAISSYLHTLPQQPVYAILFGSTAKDTFKHDSDIDILLITNTRIDTKKAEREAGAQSALRISTFQITYPKFLKELRLKEDKVIQSALNTGYPLINHIKYHGDLHDATI
jgi:predicted nucleotidyltransferase